MNEQFNLSKTLEFDTSVYEINDIKLENDFNISEGLVKINFYVKGNYMKNELSLNSNSFNFNIPVTYNLNKDYIDSTFKINVDDFSYDLRDNELNIDISYSINYEINDEFLEREFTDYLEDFEKENSLEEVEKEKIDEIGEERVLVNNDILNMGNMDDYVDYYVHICNDEDTIEGIADKYNISVDLLMEYNTDIDIRNGVKIIIPYNE